jgi:uncharacterized protein YcbK (DUF882 family)
MGNSPQISSVTNGDGSISITRERQANNNGIMQTQTGNIRLKPQDSANGAAATLTPSMREKLLGLSESVGGKTVDVSSGIRTKGQNDWLRKKNIRTAKNSQHVIGSAADININNNGSQTASDAYHSNNFGRVNIYKDGSVHVDDMPRPTGSMGFYRDWQRVGDKTPRDKPTPPKKRK